MGMEELTLRMSGGVVEWDELLNGTQLVTVEGASEDGAWTMNALFAWNIGLEQREAEGDISLMRDDGSEVFGTLATRDVSEREGESTYELRLGYEVDGGAGEFEGARGRVEGVVELRRDGFSGEWRLRLGQG